MKRERKHITFNSHHIPELYYKKERIKAKGEKLKMKQPNYSIDNLSPKLPNVRGEVGKGTPRIGTFYGR